MTTAVVLGGGGLAGIAWELGLVMGLRRHGIDLASADRVVGTSAGSVVGAQITADVDLEAVVAEFIADDRPELPAASYDMSQRRRALEHLTAGASDDADAASRIAQMALAADTVSTEQRRRVVASRLPRTEWPRQPLLISAVDADSGERVVFDGSSNVDLLDAVTASCAVPGIWPVHHIGSRRYIDGGTISYTNADLAVGSRLVVVLMPLAPSGRQERALVRELDLLCSSGAEVVVIGMDGPARQAMGSNPLDPRIRVPMLSHGRRQADAEARDLLARRALVDVSSGTVEESRTGLDGPKAG
jgi:NTE family protein